ncbi:MAG: Cna B-type domain-containing protein [Tissierellia bacterium]|nr:Cna B-type domain-containing protein [Tissierellia bacterium]
MSSQIGKKILSILLTLAMLAGIFVPIGTVQAQETSVPPVIGVDHPTEAGEVMLFKEVKAIPGLINIYDVTLRIEAMNEEQSNDIVLVIDTSYSMSGAKLSNAKAAAVQFVEQLLTDDQPNTRIALVSFSGGATTDSPFLKHADKATLINSINSLTANGGTHTQAGVHRAGELLAVSTADLKQVVMLSDGQPTYSYGVYNTADLNPDYLSSQYIGYADSYYGSVSVFGNRWATTTGIPSTMYNYTNRVGEGANMFYRYDNPFGTTNDKFYNHGNSAIAESGFIKASATFHTIALDAGTLGTPVLEAMASPDKAYSTTDSTELTGIFQTIASDIQSAMKNPKVTDPMATGFEVALGEIGKVTVSQGTYQLANDNTIINWDLGEHLDATVPGHPLIKYAELTYRIEINDRILEAPHSPDGNYDTNGDAQVVYTNDQGSEVTISFPQPKTIPLIVELKKVMLDAGGNIIETDPYGRNFLLNVTVKDHDYDKDYFVDGNRSKVMTDIRIDGIHTIVEELENRVIGTGNLDDYDTTIAWNTWDDPSQSADPIDGRTLSDFLIPRDKTDNDPLNTTITVTNKEKALGVLRITKEFLNEGAPAGQVTPREFTVQVVGKNAYDPTAEIYNQTHTVKTGETITLEGLAYGEYTVTEPNTQGFVVNYTDSEGENLADGVVNLSINSKEQSVKVTNRPQENDKTTTFTATKFWIGGDSNDHVQVELTLKADGQVTNIQPTAVVNNQNSSFTYTWSDLPKYDAGANEIVYTAEEQGEPQYYVVSYNANKTEITNTYDPNANTQAVTANKSWVNGPVDKPTTWFTLYRKIEGGTGERVTQDASGTAVSPKKLEGISSVTWENMPYGDADANPYTYYVVETDASGADFTPENYVMSGEGTLTITNTYQSPQTDPMTYTKEWVNGPTTKPAVQFQLMRRNGTAGSGEEVGEPVDVDGTTATFEAQDLTDINGAEYEYYIKEVGENHGSLILDGLNYIVGYDQAAKKVTNRFVPKISAVTAEKEWINGPEQKPDIGLKLYQQIEGEDTIDAVAGATTYLVQSGSTLTNAWNLPDTDLQGRPITYTVKEVDRQDADYTPENYQKTEVGLKVTNTYLIPKGTETASKTWVGGANIAGGRPTVWFDLYRQISATGTLELVPEADRKELPNGTTTATWTGIEQTNDMGVPYLFTVREVDADGADFTPSNYTKAERELGVTNYYSSPSNGSLAFTKVWDGDVDVTRPTLSLSLYRKIEGGQGYAVTGAPIKEVDVTTTTASWDNLLETDDDGNPFIYYVVESFKDENVQNDNWVLGNYDYDLNQITNRVITGEEKTAKLTIKKIFDNNDAALQDRAVMQRRTATNLTFDATVTGPYGYRKAVTLSTTENVVLDGLYFGDYTVTETENDAYTATYAPSQTVTLSRDDATTTEDESAKTITVTNAVEGGTANVVITKNWKNGPVRAADDVTMTLYRKVGTGTEERVEVTPTAVKVSDYVYKYTFSGVPIYDLNGKVYTYLVKETLKDSINSLYTAGDVIGTMEDGFAITNTYKVPATDTDIVATKIWDPTNDPKVTQPGIKFELWRKDGTAGTGEIVPDLTAQAPVLDEADNTFKVNFGKQDATDINGVAYNFFVKEKFDDPDDILNQNWVVTEEGLSVNNRIILDDEENDEKVASLTVKKVLENELIHPRSRALPIMFKFKVTGPYGYEEEFELAAGQTKTLEDLYYGPYQVTETVTHDYVPTYSVAEGKVSLIKTNADGTVIVTNRHSGGDEDPNIVTINAVKTWVNGPNTDHSGINLTLKRLSAKEGSKIEVVDSVPTITGVAPSFNYEWNELAKHDPDGYEYTYSVEEPNVVDGKVEINGNLYVMTQEGNTITNTFENPFSEDDLIATKTWDISEWDYENYPNLQKPGLLFELWRKGGTAGTGEKVKDGMAVENDAVNFGKQLVKDENGIVYDYYVIEAFADPEDTFNDNWVITEDGMTIGNRIIHNKHEDPDEKEKIASLTVTKTLVTDPAEPMMMSRSTPISFTFRVTGPAGFDKTFKLIPGESKTFDELYYGDYIVEETDSQDYLVSYSTPNGKVTLRKNAAHATVGVTNTRSGGDDDPNTLELTVVKDWVYGPKPNVLIELWRTGEDVEGNSIEEKMGSFTASGNNTSQSFTDLAKHDPSGKEYQYYVVEGDIENYNSAIDGLTVTNTYVVPWTDGDLVAEKVWDLSNWDEEYNIEDAKPAILFQLWRKGGTAGTGEAVSDKIAVDGESVNFGKQMKTDLDGVDYVYYVVEFFANPDDAWNDNWVVTESALKVNNRIIFNADPEEDPDHPDEKVAKLTIEKVVSGGNDKEFQVIVKGPKDFEKTVTVAANSNVVLDELYYGEYTVEEIDAKDYNVTYMPTDGRVVLTKGSPEKSVIITNTYKTSPSGPSTPLPDNPSYKVKSVVITRSDIYPDSLTASVLAKAVNAPILLTPSNRLDERVAEEIRRLGANRAYIIGGEISITPSTLAEIKAITGEVERIGGADRYETSALLANRVIDIVGNKHTATIASGEVFPDALTISPYAAKQGYPILLVQKNQIPKAVQDRIEGLSIEKTYISGGENTISQAVEEMLPGVQKRMWGPDRYGTAKSIAETMFANSKSSFIASGEVFPDALVIGPIAAKEDAPVLLVRLGDVPEVVSAYLAASPLTRIIIAGGPDTISETVANILDHNIDRIYGQDRIETAIAISVRYYPSR